MSPDRKITKDCITVAFYGISAEVDPLKSFYNDLIEWFNSVECPPDKLSVHGPGFGGKPIEFSGGHSRLLKQGFSKITAISAFAMLPVGKVPVVDWWATASLSLGYKPSFVLEARSSVTTLEDERLVLLVKKTLTFLKPHYGIGYHRDHDKGPGFYAIGLNYDYKSESTEEEKQEVSAITKWGSWALEDEVYKKGIIRDVYPQNYLSESQLKNRVGEQTLHKWISASASHGHLKKLDNRVMLWTLTASQIKAVRPQLWNAGIIFDWKKHV